MNEEVQGAETHFKILACCLPIVGAILYFVWKDQKPQAAADVCKFALIGVGIGFALNILGAILGMVAGMAGG